MRKRKTIQSPLGPLTLVEEDGALVQLAFDGYTVLESEEVDSPLLRESRTAARFLLCGAATSVFPAAVYPRYAISGKGVVRPAKNSLW